MAKKVSRVRTTAARKSNSRKPARPSEKAPNLVSLSNLRPPVGSRHRKVRVGHHTYAEIPLDALVDALLARAGEGTDASPSPAAAPPPPSRLHADDGPIEPCV